MPQINTHCGNIKMLPFIFWKNSVKIERF